MFLSFALCSVCLSRRDLRCLCEARNGSMRGALARRDNVARLAKNGCNGPLRPHRPSLAQARGRRQFAVCYTASKRNLRELPRLHRVL